MAASRGVDASPALALPGVRGFFSAADIPGARHFATPKHDEPVFAIDRVEHVGQVVGVVVAQTFQQARHAARLVKLQIDELPALLDAARPRTPRKAMCCRRCRWRAATRTAGLARGAHT